MTGNSTMDAYQKFRAKLLQEPTTYENRNIRIVALGDSVTQGMKVDPEVYGHEVYHEVFRRRLIDRYPTRTFSVINAGIAGDSTAGALKRLKHDVLDPHPDLVTVCFGLNDSGGLRDGEPTFRNNLTEIVTVIRQVAAVILLTPNMMATHDNPRVPAQWKVHIQKFTDRQTSGCLDRYADIIREVALTTATPLADAYAEWTRRQRSGEDMTDFLISGINHPDARGHLILADALDKAFNDLLKSG